MSKEGPFLPSLFQPMYYVPITILEQWAKQTETSLLVGLTFPKLDF